MPYFSLTFRVKSSGSLDGQDNSSNSHQQKQKEKGSVGGEKMKQSDDAELGKFYIFFQNLKFIKGNHLSFSFGKVPEYTEELYKKELNDTDNHDGIITHLESINLASLSLQTVTCRRTGTVSVLFPVVSPSACCVVDILGEDTNQNLGS